MPRYCRNVWVCTEALLIMNWIRDKTIVSFINQFQTKRMSKTARLGRLICQRLFDKSGITNKESYFPSDSFMNAYGELHYEVLFRCMRKQSKTVSPTTFQVKPSNIRSNRKCGRAMDTS
ncbi:uncharacterized protein LOC116931456 [Daphnia magna]|uniref:uncharacterized protein LOC116931456 n=1 Tax=Daphnia magna TaxID=35525 RepID=UPI001402F442|nr:uncharacterized protein LOC116931456 [Daphnia magna]